MDDASEELGPDLEHGIRPSELTDGAMIAGHVGEERVLLARRGDELFALDAFCTHYNGPLAEGLIVGDTVRCPWHHACFSLRSGSAVGAPAMRPLRVFSVERTGDFVRVRNDAKIAAAPAVEADKSIAHVVIVGAGAAGSFAASELRRIGFDGRVTLLTREARLPYDKPNLSKDYLAGRAQEEWIPLRSASDYASDRIDLRLGATVTAIDRERSEIRLATGGAIAFDRLILATGATPRALDIAVAGEARVHYLRSWDDADAILARVAATNGGVKNVVVIGGGFIGLEPAASLRERDIGVTVISRDELPLRSVVGEEIARFVQQLHEEHGVRFRMGRAPVEVLADQVLLDDGSSEPAELVIAGIGVEPDLALARDAGLAVDRGIIVNERLETSAPGIFAAGDGARFPDPRSGAPIRVEHWAVAGRQGQAAARNAIGLGERYASVPFFWSQHYDLVFAYVGHAQSSNDVEILGSLAEHNAAALLRDDGRIAAVITLYRDDVSLAVEAAMERGAGDDEIAAIVREAF